MKERVKFIDKLTSKEKEKMANVVKQILTGDHNGLDIVKLR